MTEMPTHTPLRLNAGDETRVMEDRPDGVCLPVCDVKCGGMSGRTVKEGEALAALIVQAVNSHHRLVEALRYLLDEVSKSACADTILDSAAAGKAFAIIAEMEGRRG